jgi:hypothetical protein
MSCCCCGETTKMKGGLYLKTEELSLGKTFASSLLYVNLFEVVEMIAGVHSSGDAIGWRAWVVVMQYSLGSWHVMKKRSPSSSCWCRLTQKMPMMTNVNSAHIGEQEGDVFTIEVDIRTSCWTFHVHLVNSRPIPHGRDYLTTAG